MGNTEDDSNKKREIHQYGEVGKDDEQGRNHIKLPKMPNKGTQSKPDKDIESK